MKKKRIIIGITISIILIFIIALFIYKNNTNIDNKMSKTKSITIVKLSTMDKKEITDSNEINNILNIIKERTTLSEDTIITYNSIADYKLKLLDKKGNIIIEIGFTYSTKDYNYITLDDIHYNIDGEKLYNIISINEN